MHGAVFAIMVQGFWTTGAIAVQTCQVITFESRCRILINGHWCSVAVQSSNEATFESRYRMLLTISVSVSGFNCPEGFSWGAGLKAKTVTNK
jgi:hypothetical protein